MSATDATPPLRRRLVRGLGAATSRLGRDPLLWVALAAASGIVIADQLQAGLAPLGLASAAVTVAALLRPRSTLLVLVATALVFAWIHSCHLERILSLPMRAQLNSGAKLPAIATGIVTRAPRDPRTQSGDSDSQSNARAKVVRRTSDSSAGSGGSLTLSLDGLEIDGHRHHLQHSLRVRFNPLPAPGPEGGIRYGDRIQLSGTLQALPGARNPGAFDSRRFFFRSIGAIAELRCGPGDHFEHLESGAGNPLRHFAEATRLRLADAITYDLDDAPQSAAILQAMTLGMREQTPDDIENQFRLSGSLHIFAVSGMHVGIFAGIAWMLLSLLRLPRRIVVLLVVPAVLFYAVVTGLRPSACRAAIMATVILLGLVAERRPRLLNSLGLAALVLLAIDTQQLFLPGFQLSFAVLASIAVLANPLRLALRRCFAIDPFLPRELVPRWRRRTDAAWGACAGLLAMSLAAWIGSAPLVIWHFHLLTPIAIASNLIMVPLATLILGVASLSIVFTSLYLAPLALLANNANWLLVKWLTLSAMAFAAVPGGHLSLTPSQLSEPNHRPGTETPGDRLMCRLLVLDTGDSGAAQIVAPHDADGWHPKRCWLIDTGSEGAFSYAVEPALRSLAVTRLDTLLLTHGDLRHIGGAPLALQRFTPRRWLESALPNRSPAGAAIEAAARDLDRESEVIDASAGAIDLGDTGASRVRVLFPPPDYAVQSHADDHAVVLRLESGPWQVLLMSDAGFVTERWLLDHCPASELRSQVIVMGRHRNDPSASGDFLRVVDPLAVISTNADFPAIERIPDHWRRELQRRGIELFDQAETGAVEIRLGSRELGIDAMVGAQTLRRRSR